MLAEEMLAEIRKNFECQYRKNNRPKDMALFIRHESEGRLHCEVNVYFPPAARTIAEAFGAVPCSKPSPENLGLLVGSPEPTSLYFNTE